MNGFPRQHHATLWAGIPFKSCTARQDTLKRGEHAQTCVTYHSWRHRLNRSRTGVSQYGPGDWTRRPLRPAVNPPPDGTGRVSTGPQYRATDTIWFPPALPETIGIPPPRHPRAGTSRPHSAQMKRLQPASHRTNRRSRVLAVVLFRLKVLVTEIPCYH